MIGPFGELGLWAPSSRVRDVSTLITHVGSQEGVRRGSVFIFIFLAACNTHPHYKKQIYHLSV
jgi:hypothetical protein